VRIRFGSLATLLLLAAAGACPGATGDLASTLAFAESLLAGADYYRAITEYERAYYLSPVEDRETRAYCSLRIGEALFRGEEYVRSAAWLAGKRPALAGTAHQAAGRRLLLRSLLRGGDAEGFFAAADGSPGDEVPLLVGVALGRQRRWSEAAAAFQRCLEDPALGDRARYDLSVAERAGRVRWKSPALAGALAVVPGLGYLYAGHRQTALGALLVNGALIASTVQAFRSDQDALGGLLALVSFSWYTGNVHGSVHAARRFNRSRNDALVGELLD
jgi:hypothetical protein